MARCSLKDEIGRRRWLTANVAGDAGAYECFAKFFCCNVPGGIKESLDGAQIHPRTNL